MTHRFPIKEIALQAGLGTATVDRVLNDRANVSPQTRNRVQAAISELTHQEQQMAARGRRLFFDFVVEAPTRFSNEIRRAAERLLPEFVHTAIRCRFHFQETMTEEDVVSALKRIARRGSHGVCLKARDLSGVRDAVQELSAFKIPVVTLVTDLPATARAAYVGLDNHKAGRTAGYLFQQALQESDGTILTTRSRESFFGEEERMQGFLEIVQAERPDFTIVDLSRGSGVARDTMAALNERSDELAGLVAVYSMGGGNAAILSYLAENKLSPKLYVAHDLDAENKRLLQQGRLNFVLHHELGEDIRNAFSLFLHRQRLYKVEPKLFASDVQIFTPENLPARTWDNVPDNWG